MGFGIFAGASLIIATAYRIHRDYVCCQKRTPLSKNYFSNNDDEIDALL
jgi:hypothetical protein